MLVIRLSRTGKTHAPHYRIVVQEKRSKLNGKTIDIVGHYHPAQAVKSVEIQKEKIEDWIRKGAQPSDTVTNILVKQGVLPEEAKVHHFFTPTKKEEVKAEVPKEVAEPVVEETAVEEKSEEAQAEEPAPEAAEAK